MSDRLRHLQRKNNLLDNNISKFFIQIANRISFLRSIAIFILMVLPYFDTPVWCDKVFKGTQHYEWCGFNITFNKDPNYSPDKDIYEIGYPTS